MGPLEENSISELILRPINPDGTYGDPIEFENVENVTCSLDENVEEFYMVGFDLAKESDMTFSGTLILPHKKMSRKKFKKWLMSRGFNRYFAEWFCKAVKSFHGKKSYRSLYLYGQLASTPQVLFNDLFDALFPITNNKESEE